MKKLFASFVFKIFGWKDINTVGDKVNRSVVIVAPHTSNLDFLIGLMVLWKMNIDAHYLIKKEGIKFPFKWFFKVSKAIAVDREKPGSILEDIKNIYAKKENVAVAIAPEGTRSLVHRWKKGYYNIAVSTGVPISLGFIDYKNKEAGVGGIVYPSGNYENDFKQMEAFYKTINARYPEKFNLSIKE